MELAEIREKSFGILIDELSPQLTERDYGRIETLAASVRQQLNMVDESVATATLLMLLVNAEAEKMFPICTD